MDLAGASREQLLAVLAQRDGELAEVRQALVAANERIAELVERVADLAARAGRDSSNSSRPPSSDPPYAPKAKRGMRGTSGRKPGKQPGAPGATRCQVEDPDEVVVCELAACPDCGSSLAGAPVERVCRRQVFDPPPPPVRPHVTEYQIVTRRCGCGRQVVGAGPAGVSAPVGYGPHAAALAVYLGVGHHLPVKRAAAVLARLAGARVSSGWLAAQRARAARLLEAQFLPRVRALLAQVGVLHVDETPGRVAGELRYVHVACTEFLTAMHVGDRSAATIDAGGVLPEFGGVLVRDGYAGYTHLTRAVHAWCGAHLIRDLHGVYDAEPDRQLWAAAMADTLLAAHADAQAARTAARRAITPAQLAAIHNHYRGAARKGITDNENRRSRLGRDALRLARRFTEHEPTILRFATDLATPFTNNEAEVRHEVARCEWTRGKEGRRMAVSAA